MKFQQITGPIMAKSVEDTAFYIYNRLASLNEVGGHPDHFGISVKDFHRHNKDIQEKYPYTMLSTSTHDTKRSEDVRCRMNVLSEMPDEWHNKINEWSALNRDAFSKSQGHMAPSRNDEYLIYQTLLGTYNPAELQDQYIERIINYMLKAINEAKTHSNWINPNQDYARAVSAFIRTIWKHEPFRASFHPFASKVAYFGRLNSLSQLTLKLTSPGIPDTYQGTELWDHSLVDPDNRRPVDFNHRMHILESIKSGQGLDRLAFVKDLMQNHAEGAIKLYLTYRTLCYRKQHASLFTEGTYESIAVKGDREDHICSFARTYESHMLITVAPRLYYTLSNGKLELPLGPTYWGQTHLSTRKPNTTCTNILTDEQFVIKKNGKLKLSEVFASIPFGLLVFE